MANLLRQYYRRAPGWTRIVDVVDAVTAEIGATESLAAVAETSTTLMLRDFGWRARSSAPARSLGVGRSAPNARDDWRT
ncbi:MAG: hypothetical protein ACRDRH_22660 [Pseudonocardia sp.]